MQELKFKRVESGRYICGTAKGMIEISKNDKKWEILFPDGKKSYRSSYGDAKAYAEKSYIKLPESKPEEAKDIKKPKQETLKEKLVQSSSYVVGCDFTGCINSGRAACILHLVVDGKSYYMVGTEGNVTDTIIHRYPIIIKRSLMKGIFISEYACKDGKKILVFDNFDDAEKAYRELNQKTIDSNHADRLEIEAAKKVIRDNDNDMSKSEVQMAYFKLNDYGMF